MKKNILVVENNMVDQGLLKKLMVKFGYESEVVGDGHDAISALEKNTYHLVLLDIQLPRLDGYDTAKIIRDPASNVLNHDIPIIAVTAYAQSGDRAKCIDTGMNDYVSKPFDANHLHQVIEKNLGK